MKSFFLLVLFLALGVTLRAAPPKHNRFHYSVAIQESPSWISVSSIRFAYCNSDGKNVGSLTITEYTKTGIGSFQINLEPEKYYETPPQAKAAGEAHAATQFNAACE